MSSNKQLATLMASPKSEERTDRLKRMFAAEHPDVAEALRAEGRGTYSGAGNRPSTLTASGSGDAESEWHAAVERHLKAGHSRMKAVQLAEKESPLRHAAYLRAATARARATR